MQHEICDHLLACCLRTISIARCQLAWFGVGGARPLLRASTKAADSVPLPTSCYGRCVCSTLKRLSCLKSDRRCNHALCIGALLYRMSLASRVQLVALYPLVPTFEGAGLRLDVLAIACIYVPLADPDL